MLISRRGFLKLIGAALASGQTIPAIAKKRAPYVTEGEAVSYIGHCPGGFIGVSTPGPRRSCFTRRGEQRNE